VTEYTAVDCQSFAGGFTLGMVQAGFKLLGKKEQKGGFGVANCEANRHLLGYDWESQVSAGDGADWEPIPCDVVFGNPPCSGFSLLSNKNFRGADSVINHGRWMFGWYTACCMPQIAIFESVQGAFTQGHSLMLALREKLEADTGQRWDLHHVLHNGASLGGSSIRRRYFWVVSRVPFGIDPPEVTRVPSVNDVIGDLEGLGDTWESQPYRRPPSWWAAPARKRLTVVDGHKRVHTPGIRRALALIDGDNQWGPKETISAVARRYYQTHGRLPENWPEPTVEKLVANDFRMGYNQINRWNGERMCRVVTGAGLDMIIHPNENRTLTHREVARIMGFPDDWRIKPLRSVSGLRMTWGKGILVDCGEWIGTWIKRALDGEPGAHGDLIGDREWVHNSTEAYRSVCAER
jgi:site-specific DNA-cytosine methylase